MGHVEHVIARSAATWQSLSLFGNHYISRIVVAIAADEGSVGECSERCAFVLSLLVGQEFGVVDSSVVSLLVKLSQAECSLHGVCKCIIHKQKVLDAPYTLICERAEACLEH